MARDESWIAVTIKNKKNGASITLYHPPTEGGGGKIDPHLRYDILGLPKPENSDITITALPSPADWLTAKVPASEVPTR